jgi:adenylate cyclase
LTVGWVTAAAIGAVVNPAWLERLELGTQAQFFRWRGPVPPPSEIVILAIDDESLRQGERFPEVKALDPIRQRFPWQRTAYAVAIEHLMTAGARVVALDVLLTEVSPSPADDRRLQSTLQRYADRVVLAAEVAPIQAQAATGLQLVRPAPSLQTTPQLIGVINFQPEVNGQWHRLTRSYLDRVATQLGQDPATLPGFDQAVLAAAGHKGPAHGDYLFFYRARADASPFSIVSFWQVLHPASWQALQQEQVFKDKVVLIGATAASLQDIQPTPVGNLPGVEIHAHAIATRLENRALRDGLPPGAGRGLVLLLGLGAISSSLIRLVPRPVPRLLGATAAAGLWGVLGYFSFVSGTVLPVALPSLAIVLIGLSLLATGAVSDQMEKLRLRRTLERYIPAPIVQEILNQPETLQAMTQGRKIQAAVLFCDIRGFTRLSYHLPAEALVAQLNLYLTAMVQAIVDANGTIDKFIGDAVMAEFGAPLSQGEQTDALNAIRCALEMRRALAELRSYWQQTGQTPLFNGIGISYGEVIAGNIGSMHRLEYTVIGDTVNVASRVEGLTKACGTDILITESLYHLVQEQVEVIDAGEHALRGRETSPIRLYSLVGWKGDDRSLYNQVQRELHTF